MTKKNKNLETVQGILGEDFILDSRLELGAKDSAHGVVFGWDGEQKIAVKLFEGKSRHQRSSNELRMTRAVGELGIRTFEPVGVIDDRSSAVSLYLSKYVPGLLAGHTLTLDADPLSPEGTALVKPVGSMSSTLSLMHGHRTTFGDPQVKNFAFDRKQVTGDESAPYVFDFERSGTHGTKGRGHETFVGSAKEDMRRFAGSLGGRQFGGHDEAIAQDIVRDIVLGPYLEGEASNELGSLALASIIDSTQQGFLKGRAIYAKVHPHVNVPA